MNLPPWLDPSQQRVTLGDIGHLQQVVAWCIRCGHRGQVDKAVLLYQRPAATKLQSLKDRLRCTSCGTKGLLNLWVERLPR